MTDRFNLVDGAHVLDPAGEFVAYTDLAAVQSDRDALNLALVTAEGLANDLDAQIRTLRSETRAQLEAAEAARAADAQAASVDKTEALRAAAQQARSTLQTLLGEADARHAAAVQSAAVAAAAKDREHQAALQAQLEAAEADKAVVARAHQAVVDTLNDQLRYRTERILALEGALRAFRAELDVLLPAPPPLPQPQLELLARDFVKQVGDAIKGG